MLGRYKDDDIRTIFSVQTRLNLWRHFETDAVMARWKAGDESITGSIRHEIQNATPPAPELVAETERVVGHDVVAFLHEWTKGMSPSAASKIHYGLTSSDVVDNVLFQQLNHSLNVLAGRLRLLYYEIRDTAEKHADTARIGRTHGQHAEPTTLGWRFNVWTTTCEFLLDQVQPLSKSLSILKSPGAVGNMRIFGEAAAYALAEYRRVTLVPSTQVIPRQRVVAWAAWMVQVVTLLEEIALEIRLSSRTDVEEMMEGAALGRVGSSAMPHKRNPVGSEQISGLARVARSHFSSIAETAGALHHERDLSNSSVERLAVPDLAELTGYMLAKITQILGQLQVNYAPMEMHYRNGSYLDSAIMQARFQKAGLPYLVAAHQAKIWADNLKNMDWVQVGQLIQQYSGDTFESAADVKAYLGGLEV